MTRLLTWDDCRNARHIGGYETIDGRFTSDRGLIRADSLARLTNLGRRAVVEHGVSLIVDLRGDDELNRDPNPFGDRRHRVSGLEYVNLPIIDITNTDALRALDYRAGPIGYYPTILTHFQRQIGRVATAIASANDGPVVIHCHAGKDRTGIVVGVLLALVGVPDHTIASDYAESEVNLSGIYRQWLESTPGLTMTELVSPAPVMLQLLALLHGRHGGPESYLRHAGVAPGDISVLRDRLLV